MMTRNDKTSSELHFQLLSTFVANIAVTRLLSNMHPCHLQSGRGGGDNSAGDEEVIHRDLACSATIASADGLVARLRTLDSIHMFYE